MSNHRLAPIVPALMLLVACTSYRTLDAPKLTRGERRLAYDQRVQLFRLDNGLIVALVPERGTNLVKVDMRYTFGAAEDPAGKSGMAHLVEHLMFTVRQIESGPSIGDTLGKTSLHTNAYTNWDETHYTATALSGNVTTLVRAEHSRLTAACADISDAVFERERQVVVQEILQRSATEGPAPSQIRTALLGADHVYTRSIGGTEQEVSSITKPEACAFIEKYYSPRQAILVVSGHFDDTRVRGLVGGLFGTIPRANAAPFREVDSLAYTRRSTIDVDGEQAGVMMAFRAPAWGTHEHITHRVLAGLLLDELRRRVRDLDHILGVTIEHVGGYRGGADAFVLWFDKDAKEAEAKKIFAAARAEAFSYIDNHMVSGFINREQLTLLRHAEPFATRAMLVADYLQYRYDHALMVAELRRIKNLSKNQLTGDGKNAFLLDDMRVIVLNRKKSGGAKHDRVPVSVATKDFDFDVWREPVDETEALRSLPLPKRTSRAKVVERTYGNGLRVVMVPTLSHPVVDVQLVLPVGSERDPSDKGGLGGLSATLLGTVTGRDVAPGDLRTLRFVDQMGSVLHSQVSDQTTTFRGQALSSNVDAVLWQLHQWIKRGAYDEDDLARLRKGVAKRRISERQKLARRLIHILGEAVYGKGHPYVPSLSPRRNLGITLSDLRTHRRAHYGLRGATLIVTGQFDAKDVGARIERLFGSMPGGPARAAPKAIPAARPAKGPTYVSLIDDEAQQPAVLLAFPTAAGVTTNRAARSVLLEMLRQRMSRIRSRYGATYGISVSQSVRRGPGALFITGLLDPNRGDKALVAMTTVLAELRQGKDLTRDFVRARRRVFGQLLATTSDSETVATSLRIAAAHGLPNDDQYRLAQEVAQLRPSAVRALIASELSPEHTFGLVAGPRTTIDKIYRTAGITPSRTLQ